MLKTTIKTTIAKPDRGTPRTPESFIKTEARDPAAAAAVGSALKQSTFEYLPIGRLDELPIDIRPAPNSFEIVEEGAVAWMLLSQELGLYEIGRLGLTFASAEFASIATQLSCWYVFWNDAGGIGGRVPFKDPAAVEGVDPATLPPYPPPRAGGKWKPSADILLVDPHSAETVLYKGSGQWAWGASKTLSHQIRQRQATAPHENDCPLIRLDIRKHKGKGQQNDYISPIFVVRAWVAPDGRMEEVPEPAARR